MTTVESAPAEPSTGASPAPLELTVEFHGDPVRFARMVSAMVNNTAVALYEATVDDRIVYPVGTPVGNGTVRLRFRPRNPARGIDALVLEEVVAIVGSIAPLTERRCGD